MRKPGPFRAILSQIAIQASLTAGLLGICCLVLIELPPALLPKLFNTKSRCFNAKLNDIRFYYISCPNNIYTNNPGLDSDQRGLVVNYTDSIGGRISGEHFPEKFNADNFHIFAIGDSFIQADEIPFDKTFYGMSQKKGSQKQPVYGVGMSSWNTQEYLKTMRVIKKKNTRYDIYLFVNDFMPSDPSSTYKRVGFQRNEAIRRSNPSGFIKSELSRFFWNIRTFALLHRLLKVAFANEQIEPPMTTTLHLRNDFWKKIRLDGFKSCSNLNQATKVFNSTTMRDLIMFALPEYCWSKEANASYESAMHDISEMKKFAKGLNSDIRFIFVTPPWNFPYENVPGRTTAPYYIPAEASMPLNGLKLRLKSDLGTAFIDLDLLVEDHVYSSKRSRKCGFYPCKNLYYFGHDGHFNSLMHEAIYTVLY